MEPGRSGCWWRGRASGYDVDDQGRFLLGLIDRTSAADTASIVLNWPMLVSR
jgi:hypothetical protein